MITDPQASGPQASSPSSYPRLSMTNEASDRINADARYQELTTCYQKGDWERSKKLIHELLLEFPGNPDLLEFQSDIETQAVLRKIGAQDTRYRRTRGLRGLLFGILGGLIVAAVAVGFVYKMVTDYRESALISSAKAEQARAESLASLLDQATLTLQADNPDGALAILDQIEAASPGYPGVAELREEVAAQKALETTYQRAVIELDGGNLTEALVTFREIQAKDPVFRDVNYQIARIERLLEIDRLVNDARTAYLENSWDKVITTYEQVIDMDSTISDDPQVKEELLYSYLKTIIETLSQDEPSIDDLDRCGTYYRKAIALIPQNKEYIAERDNLRALSVELLVTKYVQISKSLIRNPNHTEREVGRAIEFLQSALDLRPENATIKADLDKARQYQTALVYFNRSNWDQAIPVLEKMNNFDREYPNGMIPAMLYESYTGKGFRYMNASFYLDARKAFEKAEFLAWEDSENRVRLFEVQIGLGLCLGKLESYSDAVSYFDYALRTVLPGSPLESDTEFNSALLSARDLSAQSKFFESYQVYLNLLAYEGNLYQFVDVPVKSGDSLVYIADAYHSTIHSIQNNNSSHFPNIDRTQILSIPTLP